MKPNELCQRVEMVLCDVDGVLTGGSVIYDNEGIETKQFNIRDGLGVSIWQRAGFLFGLITGRTSHIVKVRAAELGVEIVRQGFSNKLPVARELAESFGLEMEQICFIGDDLPDLSTIKAVGFGVAVADAAPEVVAAADYVTTLKGGCGAVRETIEFMLKAKHRWEDVLSRFE